MFKPGSLIVYGSTGVCRAEDLLYGELSVALGIPREEVVPYIAHRLEATKS